jgi:hypothetical protein
MGGSRMGKWTEKGQQFFHEKVIGVLKGKFMWRLLINLKGCSEWMLVWEEV